MTAFHKASRRRAVAEVLMVSKAVFVLIGLVMVATLFAAPARAASGYSISDDIPYLGENLPKADMRLPAPRPIRPVPMVIVIHGGGWTDGSKRGEDEAIAADYFARAGYAVMSIDYPLSRLGAERVWPENAMAVKAAVRWVKVRSGALGIDPERIALVGFAAGGTLAAIAAMTGDTDGLQPSWPYPGVSTSVTAVVLVGAVLRVAAGTPMLGQISGEAEKASPLSWVRPGLPPFLLVHGEEDSVEPIGRATAFAEEILRVGGKARVLGVKGAHHGFRLSGGQGDLKGVVLGFLDSALGLPRRPKAEMPGPSR